MEKKNNNMCELHQSHQSHQSHESLIYTIGNINYFPLLKKGSARLIAPNLSELHMVWSVTEYPIESPIMPGAPFGVEIWYTIFDTKNTSVYKTNFNSVTGNFLYHMHSGTLPKYTEMGIPVGTYVSIAGSNDVNCNKKIAIILTDSTSRLIIN